MPLIHISDLYEKYLSSIAEKKKGSLDNVNLNENKLQETADIKALWKGRKPNSPRKVALKTPFGKFTYKEIMFYRDMNETNIMGDYEHKMTMDGCTCHKDYNVFPIREKPKDVFIIRKQDIQREIRFRVAEEAYNSKISCVPENSDEDEYTLLQL